MNIATKFLTLASASIISACGVLSVSDNTSISTNTLAVKGEHAYYLEENKWLSFGPEHTVQVSDTQGKALKTLNIKAELMDTRQVNGQPFIFTLDDNQRPTIIRYQNETLTSIQAKNITTPIEGLCLYQSSNSPMQVFLMDEDALAHQ